LPHEVAQMKCIEVKLETVAQKKRKDKRVLVPEALDNQAGVTGRGRNGRGCLPTQGQGRHRHRQRTSRFEAEDVFSVASFFHLTV